MNKLTFWIILLIPAIGVGVLYWAVKRRINTPSASGASVPGSATKVIHFTPLDELPGKAPSGNCWTSSIAAPYRADAWRCISENVTHDPCFALPQKGSVLCGADPQTGNAGFPIHLAKPLPEPSAIPAESPGGWGWLVQLSDGIYCAPFTGTRPLVNGVVGTYTCASGNAGPSALLLGKLNNTAPVWTATRVIVSGSGNSLKVESSSNVSISTVWQ